MTTGKPKHPRIAARKRAATIAKNRRVRLAAAKRGTRKTMQPRTQQRRGGK